MLRVPLSKDLIDYNKCQILVCSSPANIMVGFARHTWFLINRKGKINRWEVLHFKKTRGFSDGYIHKDHFDCFEGIELWPHYSRYHWKGTVLGIITGDEQSLAATMANFIENSFETYPAKETYSLLGPNSNTYTQWVLDHFPETNIHLPWNAIGKRYALKKPSN